MEIVIRIRLLFTAFILTACFYYSVSAQTCLTYGPEVSLTGIVRFQIFAGPPNYESIKKGDRKEVATILRLTKPTCTVGNESDPLEESERDISEVQLVVTNGADWKTIRRSRGKPLQITGTLFHAHNGHHRTKVLIQVTVIRAPE